MRELNFPEEFTKGINSALYNLLINRSIRSSHLIEVALALEANLSRSDRIVNLPDFLVSVATSAVAGSAVSRGADQQFVSFVDESGWKKSFMKIVFHPPTMRQEVFEATESLLISILLLTWSAFEVFIKDLWITSLNYGKKELIANVMKVAREDKFGLKAKPEFDNASEQQQKSVSYTALESQGFDLRNRMGTLLASERKVSFDSLRDTIKAYESAFGKNVSSVLSKALPACGDIAALEAIRNLYIHHNGKVDSTFKSKIQHAKGSQFLHLGSLEVGSQIEITSLMVMQLTNAVVAVSTEMLKLVDNEVPSEDYSI